MSRELQTPTAAELADVAPKKTTPTLDIAVIKPSANGRWREIHCAVTSIGDDYLASHIPCPRCGGKDRWNFTDKDGDGGAICTECGKFGDGFAVMRWWLGIEFKESLRLVAEYLGVNPEIPQHRKATPAKPTKAKVKPSDADEIHAVLSRLSESLPLRDDHRDDMLSRGFTADTIKRLGCWSIGTASETMALAKLNYEYPGFCGRVPGFNGISLAAREGLVILVRDRYGRIVANQVRHFASNAKSKYTWLSGKVSTGSPVHHTAGCDADSIAVLRITEGPLKAELTYQLTGIPSASVQGVSNRKGLFVAVAEMSPARVLVAFDADASDNEDVARTVRESVQFCRDNSIAVAVEIWDARFKGIDDALHAGAKITEISDPQAIDRYLESLAGSEKQKPEIQIAPDDPEQLAKKNLAAYRATGRDICHWRESWYTWKGATWQQQTESYIRARLRAFIEADLTSYCEEATDRWQAKVDADKFDSDEAAAKARPKKIKTTAATVRNALDAMQSMVVVPDHVEMGCMLPDRSRRNLWPVQNGLVDLDRLNADQEESVLSHTPNWFSDHVHDYSVDATATCPTWLTFLETVFRHPETGTIDEESIETLQRWFGYCLMSSVSLQKMLFLIGPSRSGKGVIARVLKRIVGERFTSSPMLKSFGGDFGLQPLLGKRLAIVGDLKLDRYKHDSEAALETLLNVVGEDSIDVNAKGVKAATSTSLPVKFMLLGNSLPAFRDPAMALINRVVLIQFQNSFVGKEDTELTQKLMSEIDGIFSWTLIGYDKMLSDYRLPQPESGKATIENFRKLVSPIRGFVFDCCELSEDRSGPEINGDRDQIFEMWRIYCEKIGREHPGTRSSFVRNLIESFPSIQESKLGSGRNGERRWWALVNIRLSLESLKEVDENRTQNQDADSKEGFA